MRVLLVDSRVLFLEVLQGLLQKNGITVVGTALGGSEAMDLVRLLRPEVVLLDVVGTGGDRLQTISALRNQYPAVKIIVLADSDQNLAAAAGCGACGHLLTSLEAQTLLQQLGALEQCDSDLTIKVLQGLAQLANQE